MLVMELLPLGSKFTLFCLLCKNKSGSFKYLSFARWHVCCYSREWQRPCQSKQGSFSAPLCLLVVCWLLQPWPLHCRAVSGTQQPPASSFFNSFVAQCLWYWGTLLHEQLTPTHYRTNFQQVLLGVKPANNSLFSVILW